MPSVDHSRGPLQRQPGRLDLPLRRLPEDPRYMVRTRRRTRRKLATGPRNQTRGGRNRAMTEWTEPDEEEEDEDEPVLPEARPSY